MTSSDMDEFSELVDADIPRVDLVDKAANGTTFLIAKAQGAPGLLSPDLVRDLIGKQAAEPTPQEDTVTMTGSPGAIAKLMHEAALRAAERDEVAKEEKSTKEVNNLPDSDFAYIEPGGSKDDEGKTVPRSLRHFPIMDAAHVRNALSRAPQSPFGEKAMPKIRAAAKKFDIDVAKMIGGDLDEGVDGMDPTVVLAEPDEDMDAPGDVNEPGSPAWEAIDAATGQKWLSIAYRMQNALGVMAEREMLEAASADPDDAECAFDLQDAMCAMDYVIGILATFSADEQAEAELCAEAMEMVGKALAGFDTAPLDTIEALASVRKAGRVLSSANEAAIRGAVDSLQKVLASLPQAPTADDVTKTANEEAAMPEPTLSQDVVAEHGAEPAMGVQQADPKPVAGQPVTEMAKADGEKKMVAVYDKRGNLVGIVDPEKITMIEGAEADDEDEPADDMSDADESDEAGDAPETTDLTPEPPAEAGTPADNVPDEDDEAVTKTTTSDTPSEMIQSSFLELVKSALGEHSANTTAQVATIGDAVLELAGMVETLKGQVKVLEEQPAEPKVFTNGAVPPREQMRGQDRGATRIDLTKAREQKDALYKAADATEQNRIAQDMQASAIDVLAAIHQRRA